jgi:hypothetical protein
VHSKVEVVVWFTQIVDFFCPCEDLFATCCFLKTSFGIPSKSSLLDMSVPSCF